MKIIGERIIAYLKSDTTLTNLLGSSKNICARGVNEPSKRPEKAVLVEASLGTDLNYAYGQEDEIEIEFVVSRKVANAYGVLMSIMGRVDDLLNKQEHNLSTESWKIRSFIRVGSPTGGILIDDKYNENYAVLKYDFILDESS